MYTLCDKTKPTWIFFLLNLLVSAALLSIERRWNLVSSSPWGIVSTAVEGPRSAAFARKLFPQTLCFNVNSVQLRWWPCQAVQCVCTLDLASVEQCFLHISQAVWARGRLHFLLHSHGAEQNPEGEAVTSEAMAAIEGRGSAQELLSRMPTGPDVQPQWAGTWTEVSTELCGAMGLKWLVRNTKEETARKPVSQKSFDTALKLGFGMGNYLLA